MTKAEIIQEISLKTGVEKNQVQEVVESFFKVVRNNMTEGRNVYFRGFGSFIIKMGVKKQRDILQKIKEINGGFFMMRMKK